MQHLFFNCISVKKVIKEIEAIFSISGLAAKYKNQGIKYYVRTIWDEVKTSFSQSGKYGKCVTKPLLTLSSHTQKY